MPHHDHEKVGEQNEPKSHAVRWIIFITYLLSFLHFIFALFYFHLAEDEDEKKDLIDDMNHNPHARKEINMKAFLFPLCDLNKMLYSSTDLILITCIKT